jgi:hypothetical protein
VAGGVMVVGAGHAKPWWQGDSPRLATASSYTGHETLQSLRRHVGPGGIAEVGVEHGRLSAHLAYRHSNAMRSDGVSYKPSGMTSADNERAESHWTDDRISLGARFDLLYIERYRVRPAIGAGASLGWFTQEIEQKDYSTHYPDAVPSYHTRMRSGPKPGYFVESLLAIYLARNWDLLLDARFEGIKADVDRFADTGAHEYTKWLNEWIGQVSVRYSFVRH